MADTAEARAEDHLATNPDLNVKGLRNSKDELLKRVQGLKKDLQDWRTRLNTQVESYQTEVGGLRSELMTEMEALRKEFTDLRTNLQQQMEATWVAAGKMPDQASQQPQETSQKVIEA